VNLINNMFREHIVDESDFTQEEEEKFSDLENKFIEKYFNVLPTTTPSERRDMVIRFIISEDIHMDEEEVLRAADYLSSYGILKPLFEDDEIEEILILDTNKPVYVVHRKKGKCSTNIQYKYKEQIFKLIEKIKVFSGELTEKPIIDTTLPEGVRVNITLPPVSFRRPVITIRKFLENQPTLVDLINNGTITAEAAAFLWTCIDGFNIAPQNLIICGGIGSGKTTLLNALLMFSRETERIISIEDTFELNLDYIIDWVRMKSTDEIPMKDLVKNSLRQRGDRIIVGEVRGEETFVLAAAMNVGHNCMGTIHGNTARDTILRMRSPPMNVPINMISVIHLIVTLKRFMEKSKSVRQVIEIKEVGNIVGDVVQLGEVYVYNSEQKKLVFENFPATIINSMAYKSGVSQKKILKEIKTRESVLDFMTQNKINEQSDFIQFIRRYYDDKEYVLETIKAKQKGKKENETWLKIHSSRHF